MQATVSKKSTKETKPKTKKNVGNTVIFLILCALVVVFLAPILFIVINSFKGKFLICIFNDSTFPNGYVPYGKTS